MTDLTPLSVMFTRSLGSHLSHCCCFFLTLWQDVTNCRHLYLQMVREKVREQTVSVCLSVSDRKREGDSETETEKICIVIYFRNVPPIYHWVSLWESVIRKVFVIISNTPSSSVFCFLAAHCLCDEIPPPRKDFYLLLSSPLGQASKFYHFTIYSIFFYHFTVHLIFFYRFIIFSIFIYHFTVRLIFFYHFTIYPVFFYHFPVHLIFFYHFTIHRIFFYHFTVHHIFFLIIWESTMTKQQDSCSSCHF